VGLITLSFHLINKPWEDAPEAGASLSLIHTTDSFNSDLPNHEWYSRPGEFNHLLGAKRITTEGVNAVRLFGIASRSGFTREIVQASGIRC